MIIYEFEDFDFLFDVAGCEDNCEEIVAPLFIVPIEWAIKYNYLSSELVDYEFFQTKYKDLKAKNLTMIKFVSDVLDWKLLDKYFHEDVRGFISNYTEIYSELMDYFHTDSYFLPQDIDKYEGFLSKMEEDCQQYINYCREHPEDCEE